MRRAPLFLLAGGLALVLTGGCKPPVKEASGLPVADATPEPETKADRTIYVAPEGRPDGDGSEAAPFSSVAKALAAIGKSGTILLREGVYREQVLVEGAAEANAEGWLTIAAYPGEKVVFDGGRAVTGSKPHPEVPGVYLLPPGTDRTIYAYEWLYYDLWQEGDRIRYRKQNDLAGVKAFPGSFCILEDRSMLVHTLDGKPPEMAGLYRNHDAYAFSLGRAKVRLKGLIFQNYVGGTNARAISLRQPGEILECKFFNCVRAISSISVGSRIAKCEMRDVGLGVISTANDLTVEDTLVTSAVGRFAFSELNEHLRDGLRFYYPATGGRVEGCATQGFWGGLYIKSRTWTPEALPIEVRGNLFLDGINSGSGGGSPAPYEGTAAQPKNRYTDNLVGAGGGGNDAMIRLPGILALSRGNYFFPVGNRRQTVNEKDKENVAGAAPFDLAQGSLELRGELPAGVRQTLERIRHNADLYWSGWRPRAVPEQAKAAAPAFVRPPVATASRMGALVIAETTGGGASAVIFRYRLAGSDRWITVRGNAAAHRPDGPPVATAPVILPEHPTERYCLDLTQGQLPEGAQVEYAVRIMGENLQPLATQEGRLKITGGAKELHVSSGADAERADGSRGAPFPTIQEALDRALPGDTVTLAPGVYTAGGELSHGGREGAPITVRGAGRKATIIDSGKEQGYLFSLVNAPDVTLADMTLRWFTNVGVNVQDSPRFSLLRCMLLNNPIPTNSYNGQGVRMQRSPGSTVSENIFTALEVGLFAVASPGLTLTRNTAFRNVYTAANLRSSLKNSVIAYNSFTFTGNDSIVLNEAGREALESVRLDRNNYGTFVRGDSPKRPENDFAPSPRYGRAESKAMIRGDIGTARGEVRRFATMADWREFSGQDAGSLFADPLYADPMNGDFRLLPESPNLLPDGNIIGAEAAYAP